MNVFIINFETKKIEEVEYSNLINSYAEETTTPYGVGRVDHIRERYGYLINGDEFIEEDMMDAAENLDVDVDIKPATIYEACTFVAGGSKFRKVTQFFSEKEAEEWLLKQAEYDFAHACDAPEFFVTKEEAEDFLQSNY